MQAWNSGGECAAQTPRLLRSAMRTAWVFLLACAAFVAAASTAAPSAHAGELNKADIAKLFSFPYSAGERDAVLPVWPIFLKSGSGKDELSGYVFESIDLAPIAGYAGKPINLLISIDASGIFSSVKVLSHHEPIFKHGVSEDGLFRFVDQYRGIGLTGNVKITSGNSAGQGQAASTKLIDGVSRATVSVRIVNETVLTASLKVARAKLGLAGGPADGAPLMQLKPDDGATFSDDELTKNSYLYRSAIATAAVDKVFGPGFSHDVEAGLGIDPRSDQTEVWAACLSAPQIGRAIMGKAGFDKLKEDFRPGDHGPRSRL